MATTYLRDTQAFFGPRAAGWEDRFPGDEPQFERAIAELGVVAGWTVLDVGCGTGRALPILQAAVGPTGRVLGLDATPEMLAEAARLGRHAVAALILGDAQRLPFRTGAVDAVFAAGLVPHLDDVRAGLVELARIARPGGRLAVFHPLSRAALAARHGSEPSDDDPVAPARFARALRAAGWEPERFDDAADRYLALATRV